MIDSFVLYKAWQNLYFVLRNFTPALKTICEPPSGGEQVKEKKWVGVN
ncbi:MAG: hypothetical protein AAF599_09725 [Bacteroidota bacterium]